MRFGFLGPVQAHQDDGTPVDLGGPKVRTLLALLAAEAGRIVPAEALVDGLYADTPPEGAANALQSQVSRLRRVLGPGLVEFHPTGYRLAVDPSTVDAHRFAALAAEGRAALDRGEHLAAEEHLTAALTLWRGEPPAELGPSRWPELHLTAIEDHARAALTLGRPGLVPALREHLGAHPLRERLWALLIRAQLADGRPAEALAAFEQARTRLAEDLGADPCAELAEAHRLALHGDDRRVTPLPAQLTSFIGRADELTRVRTLLREHRLVTLTGPGGAGKTRLAIEATADTPACFLALAPLTEGADLPRALLAALGAREGAREPLDRLRAALADRPPLLVLDNCEHLIQPVAELTADLLRANPALRVLATSREGLGITGEARHPVPSLDPRAAAALFADRARTADPGHDPAAHPDLVEGICQALDGLPLAIELAAARVRTLPMADIAARLDDRFGLLARGDRTAAARHRSLRGVVEWSWDLLDGPERVLAGRLTVFADGATLPALTEVCAVPDLLGALTGLVDKSLVTRHGERYRMPETIRAFCAERLADAGETTRLRHAHAQHFLALAQQASPSLLRAEQVDWLARLDAEHDNLVAALRWSIDTDQPTALRLTAALAPYWWLRGRRAEGAHLTGPLTSQLGATAPPELAEEYAICVLTTAFGTPDQTHLRAQVDEVRRVLETRTSAPRQPLLWVLWGVVAGPPADLEATARQYDAMFTADPWSRALRDLSHGVVAVYRGDTVTGETHLRTALTSFRALGERWATIQALADLAPLAERRGDRVHAHELYAEAITLAQELGATEEAADLLNRRAAGHLDHGDLTAAHTDLTQVAILGRQAGAPDWVATAQLGQAELARRTGDLDTARTLCAQALAASPPGAFATEELRCRSQTTLARIELTTGHPETAKRLLTEAFAVASARGNLPLLATVLAILADLTGDPELHQATTALNTPAPTPEAATTALALATHHLA
ncbi:MULTISPECIES: BTAD domain-containing putative transcriptional regulator [unclassified Crossiella]|uniref:BTAD domain-containing putative transcriptional regulator n=1 Tax=unclassified Crossiella TaxID=2620835 RepID=UPI0020004870|nr:MULTISPECIES: BTAD domain-containing putative transcriptional regulator [unclassified Crossiella]MCK2239842.1 winged helix-turn-helix domain-containing protein [Crossiella sp. S99.2]MCK2252550.1 winged helix-turn-helix domain-containing protein [Crossiella sp. S99.1]